MALQGFNANAGWRNFLEAQRYALDARNKGISDLAGGLGDAYKRYKENKLYKQAGEVALNGTPEEQAEFKAQNLNNPNVLKAFDGYKNQASQHTRQQQFQSAINGTPEERIAAENLHLFSEENKRYNQQRSLQQEREERASKSAFLKGLSDVLLTKDTADDYKYMQDPRWSGYSWPTELYRSQSLLHPDALITTKEDIENKKGNAGIAKVYSDTRANNASAYKNEQIATLSDQINFPEKQLNQTQLTKVNELASNFRSRPTQENYQIIATKLNPLERNYFTKLTGSKDQYARKLTAIEQEDLNNKKADTAIKFQDVKKKAMEINQSRPINERIGEERADELSNLLYEAYQTGNSDLVDKVYLSAKTEDERKYIKSIRSEIPKLNATTEQEKIKTEISKIALEEKKLGLRQLRRNFNSSTPVGDLLNKNTKKLLASQVKQAINSSDPIGGLDAIYANNLDDPNKGKYIREELIKGISAFTPKEGESLIDQRYTLAKIDKEKALTGKTIAETNKIISQGVITPGQGSDLNSMLSEYNFQEAMSKYGTNPAMLKIIRDYQKGMIEMDNPNLARVSQGIRDRASELALIGDFQGLRKLSVKESNKGTRLQQKATNNYINSLMKVAGGFPDRLDELQAKELIASSTSKEEERKFKRRAREDAALTIFDNAAEAEILIDQILQNPELEDAVGSQWNDIQVRLGSDDPNIFSKLPLSNTSHRDLFEKIQRLRTILFFPAIRQFREAGGTGALSNLEGSKIENLFANLAMAQSKEAFVNQMESGRRSLHHAVTLATPKIGRYAKKYEKGYRSYIDKKLKRLESGENYYNRGNLGYRTVTQARQKRRKLPMYPPIPTINPNTGYAVDPEENEALLQSAEEKRERIQSEINYEMSNQQ